MNQEKRCQVFISSTFTDLKPERQAALRAVLELDRMPAGMELFPAADDSAWQLIKDVINASDYYVLIVGGRYGSLDETGLGYTEKEYDYANSCKKPVIPVLHENPDNLARKKTDRNDAAWEKLESFRKKVEQCHTCAYWNSPDDLVAKVTKGLLSEFKRHPKIGWVRADRVPSGTTLADVLALRNRVSELEAELNRIRTEAPPGTEELMQGDDIFEIHCNLSVSAGDLFKGDLFRRTDYPGTIRPTWNEIFAAVAPVLINEATKSDIRSALLTYLTPLAQRTLKAPEAEEGKEFWVLTIRGHEFDTCLVQLRALGLIRESHRKRGVRDTKTYWTLTPYGDRLMVQLRSLRRTGSHHKDFAVEVELAKKQADTD